VLAQDRISLKLFILLVYILISACGYNFAGRGKNLPSDIKSIAITILKNKTSEMGIENIFTNSIIYEFTRSHQLPIKPKDKADAVLGGSIDSLKEDTFSRSSGHRALERRITITISLTLRDTNKRILWSDTGISDYEVFKVSEDRLTAEKNRRESIKKLASRIAEEVYDRIFEGF